MALSKLTRGKSDTRTSVIFALTGIALACNPLFLVYMVLSPCLIFKVELAGMLTLVVGFNILCWVLIGHPSKIRTPCMYPCASSHMRVACVQVLIGVLLNLEFFLAKWRAEVDYDVMISYRVSADAGLAQDLHRKLTGEGLRVYLDKECLKDGEPWEEGFLAGLTKSAPHSPHSLTAPKTTRGARCTVQR